MGKMTNTDCVCISLNCSLKTPITPEILVKIFKKDTDWKPWLSHLDVFFGEVWPEKIQEFMTENDLSFEQLSEIYDSLHLAWQGPVFRELRDAHVAGREPDFSWFWAST